MLRRHLFVGGAVLGLFVAGCSDGGPTDPPPETIANPTYAANIQPIFNQGCTASNCHGAAASQSNGNLDLRNGTSYGRLVGIMGDQENIVRVIPNDADNSYLIMRLENRQGVGSRMPKREPALDGAIIQTIKNWINQGAVNN